MELCRTCRFAISPDSGRAAFVLVRVVGWEEVVFAVGAPPKCKASVLDEVVLVGTQGHELAQPGDLGIPIRIRVVVLEVVPLMAADHAALGEEPLQRGLHRRGPGPAHVRDVEHVDALG